LAASETLFSYQGTLAEPGGNSINGTVTMAFALWDDPTDGNRLWGPETQTVEVSDGLFHVLLGSVVAIDPDALFGDLYLDITVNGETLSPRELLTSVAYAVEVSRVVSRNPNNEQAAVRLNWLNDVARIRIGGSGVGASNGLDIQSVGNTSLLRILGNGRVGIGTANPQHGQVMIQTNAVPFSLKESDQSGAGSLWRIPLDGKRLRFDASQNGTDFNGYISPLTLYPDGSVGCGALTEANLQTPEELAAGSIDRFQEGDVLCWGDGQLEKCAQAGDPLVQAVADAEGRPIVIGAELVKVIGPVKRGDFLVASDVPGHAMADDDPAFGTVIAQALEDLEGEQGLIKAMIRKF
jgi:hypothetical protein